jgi:hypothetical protein
MATNLRWVVASFSALALAAPSAHAEGPPAGGPCEQLVPYLRESLAGPVPLPEINFEREYRDWERSLEYRLVSLRSGTPPGYLARVTPACRAETRRAAAPEAAAVARAWTQRAEPGWIDRGRALLCTMQDPGSLGQVAGWVAVPGHAVAPAVCADALATWPGAESVRGPIFEQAVRRRPASLFGRWEIAAAFVAAANAMGTPELREQMVPVLVAANVHHAIGYDRLREAVCRDDGTMSGARRSACLTLPAEGEDGWRRDEEPRRAVAKGVMTAVFAGAVTAAVVERNHEAGRAIATGSGAPLGAVIGAVVLGATVGAAVSAATGSDPIRRPEPPGVKALIQGGFLVGALAGGVAGGLVAHSLAASPAARGPVTALALAPMYATLVLTVSFE